MTYTELEDLVVGEGVPMAWEDFGAEVRVETHVLYLGTVTMVTWRDGDRWLGMAQFGARRTETHFVPSSYAVTTAEGAGRMETEIRLGDAYGVWGRGN